jgi:hypothetical protein
MKSPLFRFLLVAAISGTSGIAAPFLAVGDGAELFVTGSLGVRSDDNIFLGSTEVDDVIIDFDPGLDLTFGNNALLQGSLTLVERFSSYADNSSLNTNLFSGNLNAQYDDGKLKLQFNLGHNELNQNSPDIRGLTRRDVSTLGGGAEIAISQKTRLSGGFDYRHEDYKRTGYTDSDSTTVPLTLYYEFTPKIDLSLGYRYREYQVSIGSDSKDHFVSVGARGEFTPKLSGKFAIGVNNRDLATGRDISNLGLDSSFTYSITPKTSIDVYASNDFGTTPQGQQQRNFRLGGNLTINPSEEWNFNVGLSYRGINYGTRTDDYVEGQIGGTYVVNAMFRVIGGFSHRKNSSDLSFNEFSNNVFTVGVNLRY